MAIKQNYREICLSDLIARYNVGQPKLVSPMWRVISSHLSSNRMRDITYSHGGFHYNLPYFVDMIKGNRSTTNLQLGVATKLAELTSERKPIICTDFINPCQFPVEVSFDNGTWKISADEDPKKVFLYEDEKYLVVIDDTDLQVFVYIFKK